MMNRNKNTAVPTSETATSTDERVQFSDGVVAIGFRTPGDTISWDENTYSRHLKTRGGPNTAILATESGRRFALGKGVAVMLPEYSRETGRYRTEEGKPLAAISIRKDLPDLTIGKPWELIGQDDKVTDVMFDYTMTTPGTASAEQLGVPSPFEHAKQILDSVADKLQETRQS
jgi:hypothetical protein